MGGNDSISGGAGGDTLIGGDGNDALGGGAGTDSIVGGTGDDSVGGGGENDTVDGGDGNDQLICGTGADSLIGGGGNDRFIVVNADHGQDTMAGGGGDDSYDVDDAGDVVIELPDQGTDTIYSTLASVTLPDNVENLVLYDGPANIRGIGNALDNSLQGSTGATELRGLAGNDTLEGDPYQSDTLIGGAGNDTYLIPYAVVGAPDVVIEQAGEGIDTLISGVSVAALADNVENLVLDPFLALSLPGPLTGVGNALSNVKRGSLELRLWLASAATIRCKVGSTIRLPVVMAMTLSREPRARTRWMAAQVPIRFPAAKAMTSTSKIALATSSSKPARRKTTNCKPIRR